MIITIPNDTITVHPDNAVFICEATARPRPSVFWWRVSENGTRSMLMVEDDEYDIDSTQTFGDRVRRSMLTVIDTYLEDAGSFVCQAENAAGDAEATAELTIYGR